MQEQQSFANEYNKAVQAHAQQQQKAEPTPELTEKQQALQEMAQALGPKENAPEQQPQLHRGQER